MHRLRCNNAKNVNAPRICNSIPCHVSSSRFKRVRCILPRMGFLSVLKFEISQEKQTEMRFYRQWYFFQSNYFNDYILSHAEISLPSLWPKFCLEFFGTNFYFRTVHFQYECTCSYWIGKIKRKYSHWKPAVYSSDIVFVSTCCQIVNAIDLWAHVAPKKKRLKSISLVIELFLTLESLLDGNF